MRLRVYADSDHYKESERKALTDILKVWWNPASIEERRAKYGAWIDHFEIVSSPDEADVHLLTMKWQHYVERDRVDQARRAVEGARRARKPIAVFSMGDFEANFPLEGDDIHLFQASGYRSRRRTRNHGMPAFFDDPLAARNGEVLLRDKGIKPVVGFCGQAGASLPRHAARLVRNRYRRLRWRLGRERWEPAPLEHTWFRQRVLGAFSASDAIESRFLLRTRYRAGVLSSARNDPAEKSRRDFVENVLTSDYTVCVRGGGNFSVRFYEALAMGRIPAFVDTDCLLPYQDQIDWRRYVVWIDEREVPHAARVVADFHDRLSPSQFRELQLECRRIWQERLTADGFYRHFHEHFASVSR